MLLAVASEFFVKTKEFFLGSSHQIRIRYVFNMQTYTNKFEETFSGEPKKYKSLVRSLNRYKDIKNKNVKRECLFLKGILQELRAMLCAGFALVETVERVKNYKGTGLNWAKKTKLLQCNHASQKQYTLQAQYFVSTLHSKPRMV